MPDFESLVAATLTASDEITCTAIVEDESWRACGKLSRYVVERSDGNTSFGSGGGFEESCDDHLAETVDLMTAGEAGIRAVVTVRWDGPEPLEAGTDERL